MISQWMHRVCNKKNPTYYTTILCEIRNTDNVKITWHQIYLSFIEMFSRVMFLIFTYRKINLMLFTSSLIQTSSDIEIEQDIIDAVTHPWHYRLGPSETTRGHFKHIHLKECSVRTFLYCQCNFMHLMAIM